MQQNETFEQRVASIRRRFIDGLDARLDSIDLSLCAGEDATSNERHARKIHRLFHDLAGNAAMLELEAVERSIRKGVEIAQIADSRGEALSDESIMRLRAVLAGTRSVARDLQEATCQ